MKLPIRYFGDPILRKKAEEIKTITPEIVQLAEDMIETMTAHHGVGLAAPQIGKLLRIYVFCDEVKGEDEKYHLGEPQVAINPVLSSPSSEMEEMEEGCLSIPGLYIQVARPKKIHIRYQNLKGEWQEALLEGFLARVNMHENDHLNGVLHVDRAPAKDRKMLQTALQQIKKKYHP